MSGRAEGESSATDAGVAGFSALVFEELRAGLHRYLLRHLRRREDVEDLIQEVYLRLLRFTDREKVRSPQAYVLRVAFNVLYEFKLHRGKLPITFDSDMASDAAETLADERPSAGDALEHSQQEERARKLMERLPPMQRAVLTMATRENFTHQEIAAKLGIAAATVRVHLFRAIEHLREEISKE